MDNHKNAGISFPVELLERIDKERGDVPRSKYVIRILEKQLGVVSK